VLNILLQKKRSCSSTKFEFRVFMLDVAFQDPIVVLGCEKKVATRKEHCVEHYFSIVTLRDFARGWVRSAASL
jgi:hypothetical protein